MTHSSLTLVHTCTHMHTYMHPHIHTHTYAHTHAYTHAYTLAHTHAYTHAYLQADRLLKFKVINDVLNLVSPPEWLAATENSGAVPPELRSDADFGLAG